LPTNVYASVSFLVKFEDSFFIISSILFKSSSIFSLDSEYGTDLFLILWNSFDLETLFDEIESLIEFTLFNGRLNYFNFLLESSDLLSMIL